MTEAVIHVFEFGVSWAGRLSKILNDSLEFLDGISKKNAFFAFLKNIFEKIARVCLLGTYRFFFCSLIIAPCFVFLETRAPMFLDPRDDFSFSFQQTIFMEHVDIAPLMSADDVYEVLTDRIMGEKEDKLKALSLHMIALCNQYNFDPAFILSLIHVESSFRVKIVSGARAIGLMQIQHATARYIAKKNNIKYGGYKTLFDPFVNLTLGFAYLAYLRDRYGGVVPLFLAAYNAGPTKIDNLIMNKSFNPKQTKQYHDAIRQNIPLMRYRDEAKKVIKANSLTTAFNF